MGVVGRHLSFSQIEKFLACSQSWKHAYVDGLKEPPGPSLRIGSAVHAALESWAKAKLAGKRVVLTDDEMILPMMREIYPHTGLFQRARYLTREMLAAIEPKVTPTHVELPFSVPLGYGDWTLDGRIDLATSKGTLIDLKTATKAWDIDKEHESQQPNAYYFAWHALFGEYPAGFMFVIVSDQPELRVDVRRTDRDEDGARGFQALAIDVAQAIERGEFEPNPAYRYCAYCPYRKPGPLFVCPAFRDGGR